MIRICLISVLLLFAGCSYIQNGDFLKAYENEIKRWTRESRDYGHFDTKLIAKATYKSQTFRSAYVDQYSHSRHLTEKEAEERLSQEEIEAKEFHDFLLVFYTPDKSQNILDQKNSPWNIYLINDKGEKAKPSKVIRNFDEEKTLSQFFPYVNVWSYTYNLRFPKETLDGTPLITEETKFVRLMITSILGICEMEWQF